MKKGNILVSDELKEELKSLGRKGETYEEIIWRLIDCHKRNIGQ